MIHRRTARQCLALLAVILALSGLMKTARADGVPGLEQPVPFGIAYGADGGDVPVRLKPSDSRASGTMHAYQVCEVVSSETQNGAGWYMIRYFDDTGLEVTGYAAAEDILRLTTAGLVTAMADGNYAAQILRFSDLTGSAAFVAAGESAVRMMPADSEAGTGGPASGAVTYVLNTNSKKFHRPDCSSVSDMKPKNRRDFTGTREEAIGMGYQPCGRCHP